MDVYVIAVDFDGTLCENRYPKIGNAKPEVIHYIKARRLSGAKVVLWTCRVGDLLDDAVRWCQNQGLIFDAVNENLPEIIDKFGGDTRKIFANEYIDDRNLGNVDNLFDNRLRRKAGELLGANCKAGNTVPQSQYLIEEMAELTKELIKMVRHEGSYGPVKEETADVLCTIMTYLISVGIKFADIRKIMLEKFDRGIERAELGIF